MAKQNKIRLLTRPLLVTYKGQKFGAVKIKDRSFEEFTISIDPQKISMGILFKKPQEVSKAQITRLQKVADDIFDPFEQNLLTGVKKAEGAALNILGKGVSRARSSSDPAIYEKALQAATNEVKGLNEMITKAVLTCDRQIELALKKRMKSDKNLKELNTEFKVIVGFKATKGVVKIGVAVTGIVVSGGVNVAAWVKAVKGVVDLAKVVNEAIKKEPKIRGEMLTAVEEFTKEWNKNSGVATGFLAIFKKSKKAANKAAAKTKRYKVEVGAILKKVDKFSGKIDAVTNEANKTMKGVKGMGEPWKSKIISEAAMVQRKVVMEMKPQMNKMIANLNEKEAFCTEIETYLVGKKAMDNFITSFQGQIKKFSDAPKFITPAMAVASLARSTKQLVDGIIELA